MHSDVEKQNVLSEHLEVVNSE